MKRTKSRRPINRLFLLIAVVFTCIVFVSCAKKIYFQDSSVLPAARGTAKIKKDKNKNYVIHVQLNYLAEPGRLQPAQKTYVVWLVNEDNLAHNAGQIKQTHNLKVDFETVSSSRPVKIFITAENDETVQNPGMELVLTTNNF